MTPEYRYYCEDILTGDYMGDLELYGVYMTRTLSEAGEFQGSTRLGRGKDVDIATLDSTNPGRTAIYCERNGELIWGGILWSRLYQTDGLSLQLYAQTWESYFDHVTFWNAHFIQQAVDQVDIFKNAVDQLQAQANSNIGLHWPDDPLPVSNIPRTVLIPKYEFHFGSEAISQVVGVALGIDYTIDPDKLVRVGYPQLGVTDHRMTYDYPGVISNYYLPESAANSAIHFAALGAGSGNKVLRATAVNKKLLTDGYPRWWMVNSYTDIGDVTVLRDKNRADALTYKMPYKTPTFEINSTDGAGFQSWNGLGDQFIANIDDYRFPNGKRVVSRMMGWQMYPASSDQPELVRINIDGSDI